MAEYLEKSKMKQYVKNFFTGLKVDGDKFDEEDCCETICQIIDFAPAADVVEVKHGEWIERDSDYDTYYDCSVCGESFYFIEGSPTDNAYAYCPNCGTKMDGGGNA